MTHVKLLKLSKCALFFNPSFFAITALWLTCSTPFFANHRKSISAISRTPETSTEMSLYFCGFTAVRTRNLGLELAKKITLEHLQYAKLAALDRVSACTRYHANNFWPINGEENASWCKRACMCNYTKVIYVSTCAWLQISSCISRPHSLVVLLTARP